MAYRNFPFASEDQLRAALTAINDAQTTGGTPSSVGAGDFNVSIANQTSMETVDRKLRQDLFTINPNKYRDLVKPTVIGTRVANSFYL